MKINVQHPTLGHIEYSESFWIGKKSLTVNGQKAQPLSKKDFAVNESRATVKGGILLGATLYMNGEAVELSTKAKWYELTLALLPIIFLLTWGNAPALCDIFPVIGGALGGAWGGLGGCTSLLLMKQTRSPLLKLLIGVLSVAVIIFVAFLLALALRALIA